MNNTKAQIRDLNRQWSRFWDIIKKYKLALTAMLLFGAANFAIALIQSKDLDGLIEQSALNLGAEIVVFMLTFVLFEAGLERIQELDHFKIRVHRELPLDKFKHQVGEATRYVQLLDSYSLLINERRFWSEFQTAFEKALENEATIRILLCNPKERGAQERAQEIVASIETDYSDVSQLLHEFHVGLLTLKAFVEVMKFKQLSNNIQVKLMAIMPSVTLHLADDQSYWSFFPKDKLATYSTHLGMPTNSKLGVFLNNEFERYWNHEENIELEEYFQDPH